MARLNITFKTSNPIVTGNITLKRARNVLTQIFKRVKNLNTYDDTEKTIDHALVENGGETIFEGTVVQ